MDNKHRKLFAGKMVLNLFLNARKYGPAVWGSMSPSRPVAATGWLLLRGGKEGKGEEGSGPTYKGRKEEEGRGHTYKKRERRGGGLLLMGRKGGKGGERRRKGGIREFPRGLQGEQNKHGLYSR